MKQLNVLLLANTGFVFYVNGPGKLLQFPFQKNAVQDLEVLDKELLKTQIKEFSDKNKLLPANLAIILLPNTTFQKDFINPKPVPGQSQDQTKTISPDEQIKTYLDSIPFEHTASKIIVIPNGVRVVATNQELFETVKKGFEKCFITTEFVAPFSVVAQGLPTQGGVSPSLINALLQKTELMKQNNLLTAPSKVITSVNSEEKNADHPARTISSPEKTDKKRLMMMLGVFGVLIIILVYMYLTTYVFVKPVTKASVSAQPIPTLSKEQTPITPTVIASQSAQLSSTIQLTGQTSAQPSTEIQSALKALGFTNITVSTPQNIITSTIISFKPTVNQVTRDAILSVVNKYFPSAISHEDPALLNDVVITIGK